MQGMVYDLIVVIRLSGKCDKIAPNLISLGVSDQDYCTHGLSPLQPLLWVTLRTVELSLPFSH